MGDQLKIIKDKRHRSSSSIAAVPIEGARSERKLEVRASIPEVDDQFTAAESRCNQLQQKIDAVKNLKKKKKSKRRRISELLDTADNIPVISVHTKPKKNTMQRTNVDRNGERTGTRTYVPVFDELHESATPRPGAESIQLRYYSPRHQSSPTDEAALNLTSLTSVRSEKLWNFELFYVKYGCKGINSEGSIMIPKVKEFYELESKSKELFIPLNYMLDAQGTGRWSGVRRGRADGDAAGAVSRSDSTEAAWGDHDTADERRPLRRSATDSSSGRVHSKARVNVEKSANTRDSDVWRPSSNKRPEYVKEKSEAWQTQAPQTRGCRKGRTRNSTGTGISHAEERPLVELFNKKIDNSDVEVTRGRTSPLIVDEVSSGPFGDDAVPHLKEMEGGRRRLLRSRHYEAPTVASRMKRAMGRIAAVRTDIPFVVSASTTPSHNLGVNLQQILNSLKIQQPPKGIPLSLANHLGLCHIPEGATKSSVSRVLDPGELNVICAGSRMLRLSSRRRPSYGKALALLRSGEGLLPRYLRTIVRPRSMFDISARRDEFMGSVKSRDHSDHVKRTLAEYAHLYRELERTDERLSERRDKRRDPALELRRQQLAAELRAREGLISEIVEEYGVGCDAAPATLRASASNAEDTYRHSTFKLNVN